MEKRKIFFSNKKKKKKRFLEEQTIIIYRYCFLEEREGVYFKLKYLLPVRSRFSDRAHYNEFVENGCKSWAMMRRRLVLGVKNTQNLTAQCPKEKGRLARGWELPTPLVSQEPLSFFWAFSSLLPALGDLCCYIPLSLVHPPPTFVNHPCPYSSARPIGHSFWRSVSCCDPHHTVQGSYPH